MKKIITNGLLRGFMYRNFSIFVKTQSTPNPHFLKFKPGKEILEEGETYEFNSPKQALPSPLARKIFDVSISMFTD
jgi:hypothetical protein